MNDFGLPTIYNVEPRVIEPVAIVEGTRARKRSKKPRREAAELAAFEPSVSGRWLERAKAIAAPMLAAGFSGKRHKLMLGVAGALLVRRVPPEIVPALCEAIANYAGFGDLLAKRRAALSTVQRWAAGSAINSRPHPTVQVAIDTALATGEQPRVEAPPTETLAETTARLAAEFRALKDGLTVFKAGCGLGKTRAAEELALERALRAAEATGDRLPHDTRTAISVNSNALATQVAEHLRERGSRVLRVFGPASMKRPDGSPECQFQAQAIALANGGQSVRWELCEGHGSDPCPYRETCRAVDGADGDDTAAIVVGTHGLITELADRAGSTGILVVDEPPSPLEDVVLNDEDLAVAATEVHNFAPRYATVMAAALDGVRRWILDTELDTPGRLDAALERAGAELVDMAVRHVNVDTLAEAVPLALELRQHAPPIRREHLGSARRHVSVAERLGRASRVLGSIHHALLSPDVAARVFVPPTAGPTAARLLALTGVDRRLVAALRRDGRTVVTSADADLYLAHYEAAMAYRPPFHAFAAVDGAPVERVLFQTHGATRANWIGRNRSPKGALAEVLREVAARGYTRPAVVTFKALAPWVRSECPGVSVGHYGALRGLDHWRDHDALVTLGDPTPNLDAVDRTVADTEAAADRATALASAELEQAHGRLRTVHRTAPCMQAHVGAVVPAGWRDPIEVRQLLGGRPPREGLNVAELRHLVDRAGGAAAVGKALGKNSRTVRYWTEGTYSPDATSITRLRVLACQGAEGNAL